MLYFFNIKAKIRIVGKHKIYVNAALCIQNASPFV